MIEILELWICYSSTSDTLFTQSSLNVIMEHAILWFGQVQVWYIGVTDITINHHKINKYKSQGNRNDLL